MFPNNFMFLNLFSKIGCGWVDNWSLFDSDKLYRTTRPLYNEALIITSTQNSQPIMSLEQLF